MGLFRRTREPFLTASPDAHVPGMSAAASAVPVKAASVSAASASVATGPAVVTEPFSLVVEDVFTITGRGTIVTGTVATGTVRRGDAVEIVRDGAPVLRTTVAGTETSGKHTDAAGAGAAVSVLLHGSGREQVRRDDVLRATS